MKKLPNTLGLFFWHFIAKQPISFTIFFLAPCIHIVEATVIPYSLKIIIDAIELNPSRPENIFHIVAPALWLGGVAWVSLLVIARLQNWWQAYVIPSFQADIRMSVLDYLIKHSYQYFSNKLGGAITNKVSDLPRALESIRMILSWNIISTISVIIASLIIVASIGLHFAIIIFIWVVIHVFILIYFSPQVNLTAKRNAEDRSALGGEIVDTISNITSVKLFSHKSYEIDYIGIAQEKEKVSNKSLIIKMNLFHLFMGIPVTIMLSFTVYFLIVNWQQGKITSGDFVFVFNIAFSIMNNLWYLGQAMTDLFREIGIAKQALTLINVPHDVIDKLDAKELTVNHGTIEFENVTFEYKRNNNLFSNKNITIKAGEKVGLIGFSGSGKTTFVNLILRFFDIKSGQIRIDGHIIADVTQDSLRRNITIIPQDTGLFHRSLMENIRYGNIDATDEEVIVAAKLAHCHEFIELLPEGYNTLVGERGIKLSGGQRQRIAIARAMLKKAPILILDEATSSLDSVTEQYIQKSLRTLMEGRTTIIIAHRLSTLTNMDRILVFDKGKIVEDGTHSVLIRKNNSHYKRMWEMQAGGFLPKEEGDS